MIEFIGAISDEDLAKADKETIEMIKSCALVRCKDCKYWKHDHTCSEHALVSPMCANEFCSRAERRTDAETEV